MRGKQGIAIAFSNRIGVDFFDSQVPCVIGFFYDDDLELGLSLRICAIFVICDTCDIGGETGALTEDTNYYAST
jgi:hypothetical protein